MIQTESGNEAELNQLEASAQQYLKTALRSNGPYYSTAACTDFMLNLMEAYWRTENERTKIADLLSDAEKSALGEKVRNYKAELRQEYSLIVKCMRRDDQAPEED